MTDATEHGAGERPGRRDIEDKLPRGIWVRVLVYVFAGHALAAFLYLLFTVGKGQ